jgi:putative FmdB family regulatory protein
MPTYEYRCKSCGEHHEVVQSFTDDPLTVCPLCAGELKKVFGSIGISFKGSGFYKTDSRGGSKTSSGGGDGSSDSKSDSSDSKSDTKTDTKTEAKPASETKSDAAPAAKKEAKTESKSARSTKSA